MKLSFLSLLPFVERQNQICYIQHRSHHEYVVWLRSDTRLYEVAVVESRKIAKDIVDSLKDLDLADRNRVIRKSLSGKYFEAANSQSG